MDGRECDAPARPGAHRGLVAPRAREVGEVGTRVSHGRSFRLQVAGLTIRPRCPTNICRSAEWATRVSTFKASQPSAGRLRTVTNAAAQSVSTPGDAA